MSEIDLIFQVMNHPLIYIAVIGTFGYFSFKHFFKAKIEKMRIEGRMKKEKESDLNSVAGKVQFAIENTDTAYNHLSGQIKDAKNKLQSAGTPEERKIYENQIKSLEQQLKIVQKILENKQYVDMASPVLIPLLSKAEKWAMGSIKKFGGI